MNIDEYRGHLRRMCLRNTVEAFVELSDSLKLDSDSGKALIILKNQVKLTNKDFNLSLISYDQRIVQKSKTTHGLLDLISSLEPNEIKYFDHNSTMSIDIFINKINQENNANILLSKIISNNIEEEYQKLALDKIKYKRLKNQIKIFSKAKNFIEENGLSINELPLKILTPLIECSSLEEDEILQDKWAKLISNIVSSGKKFNIARNYIDTLNKLSTLEAMFLDDIYDQLVNRIQQRKIIKTIVGLKDDIKSFLPFMKNESLTFHRDFNYLGDNKNLVLDNLARLGLIRWDLPDISGRTEGTYSGGSNVNFDIGEVDSFKMTDYGLKFIYNCKLDPDKE